MPGVLLCEYSSGCRVSRCAARHQCKCGSLSSSGSRRAYQLFPFRYAELCTWSISQQQISSFVDVGAKRWHVRQQVRQPFSLLSMHSCTASASKVPCASRWPGHIFQHHISIALSHVIRPRVPPSTLDKKAVRDPRAARSRFLLLNAIAILVLGVVYSRPVIYRFELTREVLVLQRVIDSVARASRTFRDDGSHRHWPLRRL
jgi:hypothetical protein